VPVPHIEEDRHAANEGVDVLERQIDANPACQRQQVDDGVGGSRQRRQYDDGVLERISREKA
jgi:hypothetical protein